MAELVDALDLGSSIERCAGSSPVPGTFQLFINMTELKAKLVGLGLSEEMAEQAIATVADFVKSKVPESFHGTLDSVLAGNAPDMAGILGNLGGLSGLFGKK
jgi:hypothetical protein